MKAFFAASLLASTLLGIGASSADVINIATWKCSQFVNADKDTVGIVLAWLDGYYQDASAPPTSIKSGSSAMPRRSANTAQRTRMWA